MKHKLLMLVAAAMFALATGCQSLPENAYDDAIADVVVPVLIEQGVQAAKAQIASMLDTGQIDAAQAAALNALVDRLAGNLQKQGLLRR